MLKTELPVIVEAPPPATNSTTPLSLLKTPEVLFQLPPTLTVDVPESNVPIMVILLTEILLDKDNTAPLETSTLLKVDALIIVEDPLK